MSVDVATLSIKVDSSEAKNATTDLEKLTAAGGGVAGMLAKIAGMAGLGLIVKELYDTLKLLAKEFYDTNVLFQRLGASLRTVSSSAEEADKKFALLQRFAATTPYELSEVTQAFIDLRTRGMEATTESLTAYGDMASSFGRSLTDTIRAISGVAMGETEAIKSYGVQAQVAGDRIALTFKGQTTVIKRSLVDVENYFRQISAANFASGMERQMKTIGGAVSNLKDQLAATLFAIGNAGASSILSDGILKMTDALSKATPALVAFTESAIDKLRTLGQVVAKTAPYIGALGAAVLAVKFNGWIVSLGALVAPFVRQIALTVALELATLKYAESLGVASLAQAGFQTALSALISPIGVVTIAIGAFYLYVRDEIKELDEAHTAFMERMQRQQPLIDARERIKELREEAKQLRATLSGVKLPSVAGSQEKRMRMLAEGTEGADVEQWATAGRMLDEAQGEVNDLKREQSEANDRIKKSAEEAKKLLQEQSAEVKKLVGDYNKLTLSEEYLRKAEIERLKMNPAMREKALLLAAQITEKEKELEFEKKLLETLERNKQIVSELGEEPTQMPRFFETSSYQMAMKAADPLKGQKMEIEEMTRALEAWKNVLPEEQYIAGLKRIEHEQKVLLADSGNLWAAMSLQVESFSTRAADALVDFFFTGKNGFSDMVDSMLRDLARLAVQQNVTQPLFSYLSKFIPTPGGVKKSSIAPGGGVVKPIAGESKMQPIVVNVTNSGVETSGAKDQSGRAIGELIGAKVREVIITERRAGGLLNQA